MRWSIFIKNNGVKSLFYDSELMDPAMAIEDAKLQLELSKAGSLEFKVYPTHPMYDSLKRYSTYVTVELDGEEIYRGRVYSIEEGMYLDRAIKCEGDLAYLLDSFQVPDKENEKENENPDLISSNSSARAAIGSKASTVWHDINWTVKQVNLDKEKSSKESLADHFTRYIATHNVQMASHTEKQFQVGQITVRKANQVEEFTGTNYRDTHSAIDGDLIKYYGGYLQTRNVNGTIYIDWLDEPGSQIDQEIKMGVNLVDLQKKNESKDLFTVLIPIGDKQLTIENASQILPPIPEPGQPVRLREVTINGHRLGLGYINLIGLYGYVFKAETFSGAKTADDLYKKAVEYLESNYKGDADTFTLKALDMRLFNASIDMIKLGSKVHIVSEPNGIDVSLHCIKVEYDIPNPENNSYEFGNPEETLSQKNSEEKRETAKSSSSASHAAYTAQGSTEEIEEIINQHAKQIKYTADELFEIATKTFRMQAYAVEVKVDETVKLTANDIEVKANGSIAMSAGSQITIGANGSIEMDSGYIRIGDIELDDDDDLVSLLYADLMLGGEFKMNGDYVTFAPQTRVRYAGGTAGTYSGTYIMQGELYSPIMWVGIPNTSNKTNLGTAVVSFGTPTSSNGRITIPYTQAAGGTGNVTFNMADTEWYQERAVAEVTAVRETTPVTSGNTVSATFSLHARNADHEDIIAATRQTISMTFSGGGGSNSDIRLGSFNYTTDESDIGADWIELGTLENLIRANPGAIFYFDAYLQGQGSNPRRYFIDLG